MAAISFPVSANADWFGAAQSGNLTGLQAAYAKDRINAKNKDGLTALHLAVDGQHLDLIKYLLRQGALPDVMDSDGNSALLRLHCQGNAACLSIARSLIIYQASVDLKNRAGQTALMAQADTGDPGFMRLLLAAGADHRQADKQGFDALYYALYAEKDEAVRLLLGAGACVSGKHLRMADARFQNLLVSFLHNCRHGVSAPGRGVP